MPKGIKAAPPQQATLGAMWGAKKKKDTPKEPKVEDISMDIDQAGAYRRVYYASFVDTKQRKVLRGRPPPLQL